MGLKGKVFFFFQLKVSISAIYFFLVYMVHLLLPLQSQN